MSVLLPGSVINGQPATLGVMGGGQLGRMFVHAAQAMGYYTAVLDPDPASPAGLVSHHHIQTDYLDEQGLAQLMQRCAAITTPRERCGARAFQLNIASLTCRRDDLAQKNGTAITKLRHEASKLMAGIGHSYRRRA